MTLLRLFVIRVGPPARSQVIHGQDDPLVPVAAAHDLARHIPDARLHVIPGMGHDIPEPLVPRLGELLLEHAGRAEAALRATRLAA